jgi:hypothetical protein
MADSNYIDPNIIRGKQPQDNANTKPSFATGSGGNLSIFGAGNNPFSMDANLVEICNKLNKQCIATNIKSALFIPLVSNNTLEVSVILGIVLSGDKAYVQPFIIEPQMIELEREIPQFSGNGNGRRKHLYTLTDLASHEKEPIVRTMMESQVKTAFPKIAINTVWINTAYIINKTVIINLQLSTDAEIQIISDLYWAATYQYMIDYPGQLFNNPETGVITLDALGTQATIETNVRVARNTSIVTPNHDVYPMDLDLAITASPKNKLGEISALNAQHISISSVTVKADWVLVSQLAPRYDYTQPHFKTHAPMYVITSFSPTPAKPDRLTAVASIGLTLMSLVDADKRNLLSDVYAPGKDSDASLGYLTYHCPVDPLNRIVTPVVADNNHMVQEAVTVSEMLSRFRFFNEVDGVKAMGAIVAMDNLDGGPNPAFPLFKDASLFYVQGDEVTMKSYNERANKAETSIIAIFDQLTNGRFSNIWSRKLMEYRTKGSNLRVMAREFKLFNVSIFQSADSNGDRAPTDSRSYGLLEVLKLHERYRAESNAAGADRILSLYYNTYYSRDITAADINSTLINSQQFLESLSMTTSTNTRRCTRVYFHPEIISTLAECASSVAIMHSLKGISLMDRSATNPYFNAGPISFAFGTTSPYATNIGTNRNNSYGTIVL